MEKEVKEGTVWTSSDHKEFQVVKTYHFNGKTWVHYRDHFGIYSQPKDAKEYTCYLESFVHRFRPTTV